MDFSFNRRVLIKYTNFVLISLSMHDISRSYGLMLLLSFTISYSMTFVLNQIDSVAEEIERRKSADDMVIIAVKDSLVIFSGRYSS